MKTEIKYKDIITSMLTNEDVQNLEMKINDCLVEITFHRYLCNIKDYHKYFIKKINKETYTELDKVYPGVYYKVSVINDDLIATIMSGNLLIEIYGEIYIVIIQTLLNRSISDSLYDAFNLFGSRDGLIESVETNVALIQKRIKSSNIVIENIKIGRRSKTDVRIMYIKDIANKESVKEVMEKLNSINTDAILTTTNIYNVFTKNNIFPLANETGNPGVIAERLYEGKIAILIDQIPIAITVPTTLTALINQKEGKNSSPLITFYQKSLLFIILFLSIFFLGIYAALVTFHTKNMSLIMISEIKASLRGSTVPLYFEFILIIFLFDLLRLSGSRSPNISLQTVLSTVGGLLIGQNAVNSGFISSFNLVVAAICYISAYGVTSNQRLITTISILRYLILFFGLLMGIGGIIICSIGICCYLAKSKSLSIDYFAPFAPFIKHDFFKNILTNKIFRKKFRDKSLHTNDNTGGLS